MFKDKKNVIIFVLSFFIFLIFFFLFLFVYPNYKHNLLEKEYNDSNFENDFEDLPFSSNNNNTYNDLDQNKINVLEDYNKTDVNVSVYFCPEDACKSHLISLINNSKESISCAIYSITDNDIYENLLKKHNEGVEIRLVTDLQNTKTNSSKIGLLKAADVSVITNSYEQRYMHHKFCVFDNKILLIGSLNFTLDSFLYNNNNILVIEDQNLSEVYLNKIDSYFHNNFSKDYDSDPKIIKNTEINFCPNDNCFETIVKYLRKVEEEIYCMFYSYTLNDFSHELKRLKKQNPDSDIKIIIEKSLCNQYCEYDSFEDSNIEIIFDKNSKSMHHKFCIIDNKIVMTGSMNMSSNGIRNNEESLIFVKDKELSQKYKNYFLKYWDLWGSE